LFANLNKLALEVKVDPEHGSIADDPARFCTTRWSAIIVAEESEMPSSHAALTGLCRFYWYSWYAFARRRGHGPPDARDLAQEIHSLLIAGGQL